MNNLTLTVSVLKAFVYSLRNQFNLIEYVSKNSHLLSDDDIKIMIGNALQTITGLLLLYGEHKVELSEMYDVELRLDNDDLIISTLLLPHYIICHLEHIELMRHCNPDMYLRYENVMQQMGFIAQCMHNKHHYRKLSANYSFPKLVEVLNRQVTKDTIVKMDRILGDRKEVTSIRLRPKTRAVLQVYSDNIGISVSQIINIMVDGVVQQTLQYASRKE